MAVQGFSFATCATSMVSGFTMDLFPNLTVDLNAIPEQVSNLLQRGGMSSMMNTTLMAFCAFSFIGALTVCGSMDIILEKLTKHIHNTGQLITSTVAIGVVMIIVIGEAAVTHLMIGGMFREEYIRRGLETKNLSRCLEDSITVIETSCTVVACRCIYDLRSRGINCAVCAMGVPVLYRSYLCNHLGIYRLRYCKDQEGKRQL